MKIIIIGGGLSGLATSALLASKGYEVDLYEKNKILGGRAQVLKKHGYVFDMGPSWYMMPEVIEGLYKRLGTSVKDHFTLKKLDPKYKIFRESSGPLIIVSNLERNLKLFEKLSPGSAKIVRKIIYKADKAYSLSVDLLQKPYHTIVDFFNFKTIISGLQLLWLFNPFQSYHRYIKKQVSDPILQKILEFHTVFLGGDPKNTPALYSILIAADFTRKIWYPMGGMGMIPESLAKIAKNNGVKIYSSSSVEKILVDSKTNLAKGVLVGGKKIHADIVISSADYAFTDLNLLPKKYQEYSKSYWDSRDYAISTVLVYLGVDKKFKNLEHHNFYFQDDWTKHFKTIEKTNLFPEKPSFYVCNPSKTDSSVAPKNKENLFVLIPITTKTSQEGVDEYVDKVLKHIEEKIGEKFIDKIEYKKVFSQKDFISEFNAYKGNALGLGHTLSQSVLLRPKMNSSKLKNLYYTGHFTQPGVGVPMVLVSAQYAFDQIIKKYPLRKN